MFNPLRFGAVKFTAPGTHYPTLQSVQTAATALSPQERLNHPTLVNAVEVLEHCQITQNGDTFVATAIPKSGRTDIAIAEALRDRLPGITVLEQS